MDRPQILLVAIATVFIFLTWATTLMRIYVKAVMAKHFGAEDYLAFLALAVFTGSVGVALKGIMISGGKHFVQLTLAEIKESMMWWFILELCYTVTISLIRGSIALFLLRITTLRSQIILIWTCLAIVTAYSIFYIFFIIFQCNPPAAFWTEVGGNSQFCVKASVFGIVTYVHSGLGAAIDFILALIPIFLVARLQMNLRTKVSVSLVLGLGGIAAIAVIVRTPYVRILVNSTDFLYDCTNVVIWTAIEPGLGLTAASLATLRPLFQAFLNRTRMLATTRTRAPTDGYGKSSRYHGRSNYIRSTSKGGGADSDIEFSGGFDFEMPNMKKAIITTTINSPGLGDDRDGEKMGRTRSESLTRLKRATQWSHSGEDSLREGAEVGVRTGPVYQIQKTVEFRTQSGILL